LPSRRRLYDAVEKIAEGVVVLLLALALVAAGWWFVAFLFLYNAAQCDVA
jgi:hypothetical protein